MRALNLSSINDSFAPELEEAEEKAEAEGRIAGWIGCCGMMVPVGSSSPARRSIGSEGRSEERNMSSVEEGRREKRDES